ncbi:MAG: hypothetical protein KC416_12555 [Myxococcales bacterium]|nr:hypothetical protein [Myxococcales bacterium]
MPSSSDRLFFSVLVVLGLFAGCGSDTGAEPLGDASTLPDAQASDGAPDGSIRDASPMDADTGPVGSAGCVDGDGIPEGQNMFMSDGRTRNYFLYLPKGYDRSRPWPLLFALHGNGGTAAYWNQTTGERNVRGEVEDDAILVVAEAIEGNWRDYGAPSTTWPARIEQELNYFDAIVDRAKKDLCIDENAIFSMGFSGGGSFSGVLACRRPYIRAFAAGGSVIYFDPKDCVHAPPAWITIGKKELIPTREEFRDYFRDAAGCTATAASTPPDPCVAYQGCDDGKSVHYCEHPDGHIWPSFGTSAMWDFLGSQIE